MFFKAWEAAPASPIPAVDSAAQRDAFDSPVIFIESNEKNPTLVSNGSRQMAQQQVLQFQPLRKQVLQLVLSIYFAKAVKVLFQRHQGSNCHFSCKSVFECALMFILCFLIIVLIHLQGAWNVSLCFDVKRRCLVWIPTMKHETESNSCELHTRMTRTTNRSWLCLVVLEVLFKLHSLNF